MLYHRLTLFIFTLSLFYSVSAQAVKDSVTIDFRQSKVSLDTSYMNNREAFEHIRQIVNHHIHTDSDAVLLNVDVVGGASPEGSVRFNNWLSKNRAAGIYNYLGSRITLLNSLTSITLLGRDWHGLQSMVAADDNVPYRDDVIALLNDIIAKSDRGEKDCNENLLRLKQLHGGVPYLYLYHTIFPYLRQAGVVLTYINKVPRPEPLIVGQLPPIIIDKDRLSIYDVSLPVKKPDKPFYMAIKSNLLADALALPELGVEFYLGKNLSIVGNWMYGWWDKDKTHRYWRAYGGDIALRWWFGKAAHTKPLTGHHLGIYGGVLTYDFEFGGKGYMGGRPGHDLWDRCMKYGGIEYGYSLPVARRFNIDFTVGLGYMGGKYIEYVPADNFYAWEATKQKHWIGPTKLEISLVWLVGHGNYNKKGAK